VTGDLPILFCLTYSNSGSFWAERLLLLLELFSVRGPDYIGQLLVTTSDSVHTMMNSVPESVLSLMCRWHRVVKSSSRQVSFCVVKWGNKGGSSRDDRITDYTCSY